jgi:hypothetical protein
VEHRRLAFLVHIHLEQLLHFQVAPVLTAEGCSENSVSVWALQILPP